MYGLRQGATLGLALLLGLAQTSACGKKKEGSKEEAPSKSAMDPAPSGEARRTGEPPTDPVPRRRGGLGMTIGKDIKIVPGGPESLGGFKLLLKDKPVWPPTGAGCEKLVSCCTEAVKTARFVSIACQLGVTKAPIDCGRALTTVRKIMEEKKATPPPACAP